MEFKFKCPHCNNEITEKDFQAGTKTFSHLQQYFEKQRHQYLEHLTKELEEKWAINQQLKIEAATKQAALTWQAKLHEKDTIISNHNILVAQKIAEKTNELNEKKYQEINQLKTIIEQNNSKINNFEAELKTQIAMLTNQLNQEKQQAIEALQTNIQQNQILIENHDAQLKVKIAEREKQLVEEKYQAIAKLRDEINQHVNHNNQLNAKWETSLIKQENYLKTEHQKIISNLQQEIQDLKTANNAFKIIQNKTKGENFEHEVEAELRKVFEPDDLIQKITTKDQKADYLHAVRKNHEIIGKVVYEVKNAEWSNLWEKKLVEDIVRQKAQYGIIICTTFNKKFPGIPFKRSDEHANIYLCDTESFCFIGQILKTLIQVEANLVKEAKHDDYHHKIQQFNDWKMNELPKFSVIFQESLTKIAENEDMIIKKVDTIRIAREKIQKLFLKNIYNFLSNISFS